MADIELVIKIPKQVYNYITRLNSRNLAEEYIKNGTPLPKGHGRLIDADKFISEHFGEVARLVDDAPTIIESDTESEVRDETHC